MEKRRGRLSAARIPAPAESGEALDLARSLLEDGRAELRRADDKASSLLTAIGVAVGVLLTGTVGGVWSPGAFDAWSRGAWWLGITATGVALCALVSALLPRLPGAEKPEHVGSFVDVVRLDRRRAGRRARGGAASALDDALRSAATRGYERTLEQVHIISRIADVKCRRIRAAIAAMAVAATALGLTLALHTLRL